MKFGVFLPNSPQADIGKASKLAIAFEDAGFDYLCMGGHVLSARPGRYPHLPGWVYDTPFADPFVLFGYLAAVTSRIRLITSVAILPGLSTAVVARQAVELAFVSGDRFDLGIGLSWQEAEFRALGADFHRRGRRMTEQMEVLRLLWSSPFVSYKGEFHDFDDVGLGRLPDRPIPLWVGSSASPTAHRRVAALADGWMTTEDPIALMPKMREHLVQAGRDPNGFPAMFRIMPDEAGPDAWVARARQLRAAGITHLTIWPRADYEGTAASGLKTVVGVLRLLRDALA